MDPIELAAGRYWFDLFPVDRHPFAEWREANAGAVVVVSTAAMPDELEWVLFDVLEAPVLWPLPGRPTRVREGEEVNDPTDVIDAPDPEADPLWRPGLGLGLGGGWGLVLGGAAVLLGAGWLLGRRS